MLDARCNFMDIMICACVVMANKTYNKRYIEIIAETISNKVLLLLQQDGCLCGPVRVRGSKFHEVL